MLDRDEMLEYMRLRGKMNALVADFMTHYCAARLKWDKNDYEEQWQWLWALSDEQKIELIHGIISNFGAWEATVNTEADYAEGKLRLQNIQALFSITQMTVSLRNASAV